LRPPRGQSQGSGNHTLLPPLQIDVIETIEGDELKFSDDIRFSTESYEVV
jgi:hypothetical protein